jgi:vacuolar protein sorting-associated protein IST1
MLLLLQVEHIIREENMMAAQEILELFCELVAVRLPIIEAQKFVPLPAFPFYNF